MPVAVTLKAALLPHCTVWADGGTVMVGGSTTVSVATALVAAPPEALTTAK